MFSSNASQASSPIYIEDVFSTYLYTGAYTEVTVNNGIDLASKGGLVWLKPRSAGDHFLQDSARGINFALRSNTTAAQDNQGAVTSFTSTGFTDGQGANGINEVSWTFRKQAKFFDIVTYTGNGAASQTINHNLGSVPGCMIVKGTSASTNWPVYHRSMDASPQDYYVILDGTTAKTNAVANWGNTAPTSTQFTVGGNNNANGLTYVAYIFAHDAGGFGLAGTDNVISCGSFTTDINGNFSPVTLGYEPQWLMFKRSSGTDNWKILDNMRGIPTGSEDAELKANLTNAETTTTRWADLTSTGFTKDGGLDASSTYIYIAIRRGPMKVPTLGTSVYNAIARTGTSANATVTSVGFPVDLLMSTARNGNDAESWWDRLRNTGGAGRLLPSSTSAEIAGSTDSLTGLDVMDGFKVGVDTNGRINYSPWTYVYHCFRRAPGFFDEVCYAGDGTDNRQVTHNLGVTPELIINKNRGAAWPWWVGGSVLGSTRYGLYLNDTSAIQTNAQAFATVGAVFTSSYFLVSSVSAYPPNANGYTNVAYLFATCAGVSKVGTYTGTGATINQINCGFTAGARFVLIKRTDQIGDWYVWDTVRGIIAGNDPYLLLNSAAAEVTNTDYIDTYSAGFEISTLAPAGLNLQGGTYIFLAIA